MAGPIVGGIVGGIMYHQHKKAKKAEKQAQQKQDEESKETLVESAYPEFESESFICPITCQLIKEPATTVHGQLFEYTAILEWVERKGTCPVTNQPLTKD